MIDKDDPMMVVLELYQALQPFALYANCVKDMGIMEPVAKTGNQAIVAGAFQVAREIWDKRMDMAQGLFEMLEKEGTEPP